MTLTNLNPNIDKTEVYIDGIWYYNLKNKLIEIKKYKKMENKKK